MREQAAGLLAKPRDARGFDGRTYHQERSHDPIDDYAEPNLYPQLFLTEGEMQCLVLYFTEDRIHHNEQPDGYIAFVSKGEERAI